MDISNELQFRKKINSFIKENWDIIVALAAFIILSIIFFNYYLYSATGDAISYINIAKAYASGDLFEAVNGLWSPFFSWLMVPFLLFNSNQLYAVYVIKVVSLIIGFFTILSIRRLYNKFEMDLLIKRVFLFSLIPVILYFSLRMNTPDLLVVLILFYYLSLIFDPKYSSKISFGIMCGIMGGLAFLTKSYLFFFFIIHFIMFNLIYYFKSTKYEKRKLLMNLIFGLTIFFIISGIWIVAISDKYDKFTLSTAGEYNQAIVGPDYLGHHQLYYAGLIKPPGKYATSIWDEPSYTKLKQWSPFQSWINFQYQIQLMVKNIINAFIIIESFFMVSIILLILALVFIFKFKSDNLANIRLIYLLLSAVIYISGYICINIEWRYFWFIFIIIMFIGFYMVSIIYKNNLINSNIRNILIVLLVFYFTIQPSIELLIFSNSNNYDYNLSRTLKGEYGIQGNLASYDNWNEMTTISYYLNAKYYGLTKKTNNTTDLQMELKNFNIDYFFVWDKTAPISLIDYKEITGGKLGNIRIYSRIK